VIVRSVFWVFPLGKRVWFGLHFARCLCKGRKSKTLFRPLGPAQRAIPLGSKDSGQRDKEKIPYFGAL
jgi:hypothetical protein